MQASHRETLLYVKNKQTKKTLSELLQIRYYSSFVIENNLILHPSAYGKKWHKMKEIGLHLKLKYSNG